MKDKILKLSKRLKNFSLSEISVILEAEDSIVQAILEEMILENHLIKSGESYSYNKKIASKGRISKLPLFFHFHSSEDIDLLLKGFCADISIGCMCNLVGMHKNVAGKFYQYYRQMIYNSQKAELERYFKLNPKIGKERKWYTAKVFLYIYDNKLFISDQILKSVDCAPYKESDRLEIKKQYLRCFRKVQNNAYQYNFHLHLAEEIWKYNKDFQKRYELLKTFINC